MRKGYAIFRGNDIILFYCPRLSIAENNKLRIAAAKKAKKDGPFYLAMREESNLTKELNYV